MRQYIAFIIILIGSWGAFAAEGNSSPTFQLAGDVSLLSHYVENGISQSEKSPALQGSFWFNFGPQFRLGLWGSNTNFPQSSDHFNLRGNADIKVNFSQNSHLVIAYSQSQYYNGGDRNGNILGLHLSFGEYRVLYDSFSNWEATKRSSARFAFGKISTVFGNWKWNNELAHNTPSVNNIKPYFDVRTSLGAKWSVIFLEGALTATNASSSLNGRGDVYFILSASTDL